MRLSSDTALLSGLLFFLIISGCVQQTTPESESQSCATNLDPAGTCTNILDLVCGSDGRTYINCCHAQRAGANISKLGACDTLGCKDNDSGYNTALAGTVEAGGENKTDYCIDSSTLIEYECRTGQIFNSLVPCPSGRCEDGRCAYCTESDNGPDIFTAGEVRLSFDTPYTYMTYKDECVPSIQASWCTEIYNDSSSPTGYGDRIVRCTDPLLLRETSCKYGFLAIYYVNCPPGSVCLNGKCVYG